MGFLGWWLESLDYQVKISNTCLRIRSPHSHCEACVAACPRSALVLSNGKVEIDINLCNSCGECLVSCPVSAMEGILPKRAVTGTALLYSDAYVPAVSELLVFHANGIRTIAFLENGLDMDLSNSLDMRWERIVAKANAMLEQLNQSPFLIEQRTSAQLAERYTRRQLFSLWKHKGKTVLADLMPAEWRFNQRDLDLKAYYPDYQFYEIEVLTEKCSLCQACKFACPNACIQISNEKMLLNSMDCINCELCADVCPEQAVMVHSQISSRQSRELEIEEKTCVKCGSVFSTLDPDSLCCIVCRKQQGI